MTEPLADRLLDALGDPIARRVVHLLLENERTQADLIDSLEVAQASISRVVKVLRVAGLVAPVEGGRGSRLAVVARPETLAVFLAADRLAEQLLDADAQAQRHRSQQTRRSALRPVKEMKNEKIEHP